MREEADEGFSIWIEMTQNESSCAKEPNWRSVPLIYAAHMYQRAVSGPWKEHTAFPS